MATETTAGRIRMRRRDLLAAALLAGGLPAHATLPRPTLLAAWERADGGWRVGMLREAAGALRIGREVEVPTRAHGLSFVGGGEVLAVARRPGDWLLRWSARTGRHAFTWAEPDRAFTGHALHDARTARLYTGEMRLDTGMGLIGVRDATSLDKLAEWPTGGRDPHEFLLDGAGGLIVANGGIETRPESGRRKLALAQMDSSLVRLHGTTGEPLGRWQVDDRRLSLRHMAWGRHHGQPVLGIAMQAEHEAPADRLAAPTLALFDGQHLRPAAGSSGLAGYAGDIAWAGNSFALSAPRAGLIAWFDGGGHALRTEPLAQACPLAAWFGGLAAGGAESALLAGQRTRIAVGGGRLDNHWAWG